MLCVSLGSFAISILGITMMYIWFAPRVTCSINIFLITWTLILIQVITSISLHSKVSWPWFSRAVNISYDSIREHLMNPPFECNSGERRAVNIWFNGLVYSFSGLVFIIKVCNYFTLHSQLVRLELFMLLVNFWNFLMITM